MNIIQRPISNLFEYRTPKNGEVSIAVLEQGGSLEIEIRHNGFLAAEESEKLIKKSFDFFIPNDELQRICRDGGLVYKYAKPDKGFNVTKIMLPSSQADVSKNNVVNLFK